MFPYLTDVKFRVSKRYKTLTACKDATNMKVCIKTLYDIVDVERGADRGRADANLESQQQL